ncbi:hypothetical protein Tco_0516929 [Tanacetum coccineum]
MSSNEESSRVTYTSISSYYEEPSDASSPGVIVYGYDELAIYPVDPYVEVALQALPSLNYVFGPEEPEQAPPLPNYVPGPKYPEYLAPYDAEIPASKEDEEEEEEEHLAPANSTTVSLAVDPVPSIEETKLFETDESAATPPPPAYRTTYRMYVRSQAPILFPSEAEIISPPLPVPSPLTTSPTYTEAPLGYRVAGIRLRAASPLPLPSPPLSPPLSRLLLPSTDHRADILEAVLLPRKRLFLAPGPRFKVGENSSNAVARPTRDYRANYGFIGSLDAELRHD